MAVRADKNAAMLRLSIPEDPAAATAAAIDAHFVGRATLAIRHLVDARRPVCPALRSTLGASSYPLHAAAFAFRRRLAWTDLKAILLKCARLAEAALLRRSFSGRSVGISAKNLARKALRAAFVVSRGLRWACRLYAAIRALSERSVVGIIKPASTLLAA